MTDVLTLDEIGVLEGTDKSSLMQDYLRHYELYLKPLQTAEINILEIGVLGGRSLRTWTRFFSRATIVGIDIMELCRQFERDRVHIEIGSQDDPDFLSGICDKYPPTLVIDDGSHVAEHIRTSFTALFPRLLPGGWYVIEDLHMVSTKNLDPYDQLTAMAKGVGLWSDKAGQDIDSIAFVHGAVFIRKADHAETLRRLDQTVATAERTGDADSWMALAIRMSSLNMLDRAESAMRKAVALNPTRADYHWQLSHVLMQREEIEPSLAELNLAEEYTLQEGKDIPDYFNERRKHLNYLLEQRPKQ